MARGGAAGGGGGAAALAAARRGGTRAAAGAERAAPARQGRGGAGGAGGVSGLPARATVIDLLRRANTYFVNKWPDPATRIDSSHESHIWTRAVYYEGLMGLNAVDPQASYVDYAVRWGTSHSWGLVGGTTTRSADNQCAGQTYIDLYNMDAQAMRMRDIKADIDMVVAGSAVNDWTWVDAIQMAMPVFAKLGGWARRRRYFEKAYAMYANTKNVQGGNGPLQQDRSPVVARSGLRSALHRAERQELLLVARQRLGVRGADARARHHPGQRGAPRGVPRRLPGDGGGAARGAAQRRVLERQPASIRRTSADRS